MKIIPSLDFNGNAEEAILFYQKALDGKITGIMRYKDMPGAEAIQENSEKILHAELTFGDCAVYCSDYFYEGGIIEGNRIEINIDCDSENEIQKFYDGLKEGAQNLMMEPQDTFWGAYFARVIDKYGVGWSFNFTRLPVNLTSD